MKRTLYSRPAARNAIGSFVVVLILLVATLLVLTHRTVAFAEEDIMSDQLIEQDIVLAGEVDSADAELTQDEGATETAMPPEELAAEAVATEPSVAAAETESAEEPFPDAEEAAEVDVPPSPTEATAKEAEEAAAASGAKQDAPSADDQPDQSQDTGPACLEDLQPHNGIPLLIVRVNEEGDNPSIDEMNSSERHSVRCIGTVEIVIPEGYDGGYATSYASTTGEMSLTYIHGRGNSTWTSPKKPYKIKFVDKQDLFGMGKSREWALMANSLDPTLIKNRITFDLGEMLGLEGTPQAVPVEVVMIGTQKGADYLGCYDLSELVKLEKSRLDLKTPNENATQLEGDGNITGSYLMAIYDWIQDVDDPASNHFTTDAINGLLGFLFNDPEFESEELTTGRGAQRDYVQTYIRNLEAHIMEPAYIDAEQHALIGDMMDLVSTANHWWVQIFSKNTDSFATSSTHLYKKADDKLYWGPLLDFDMAWSFDTKAETFDPKQAEGWYYTMGFAWIDRLRKTDPAFVRLLKDCWHEFDAMLDTLTEDGGILDRYERELAQAQEDDYQRWSWITNPYQYNRMSDYSTAIERLRQLIVCRQAWINENLETVGSFLTVSFDAGGGKGQMADDDTAMRDGEYELPACGFSPAEGTEFVGWQIGDAVYDEGAVVTLAKDTVVTAVWKEVEKAPEEDGPDDPGKDEHAEGDPEKGESKRESHPVGPSSVVVPTSHTVPASASAVETHACWTGDADSVQTSVASAGKVSAHTLPGTGDSSSSHLPLVLVGMTALFASRLVRKRCAS